MCSLLQFILGSLSFKNENSMLESMESTKGSVNSTGNGKTVAVYILRPK